MIKRITLLLLVIVLSACSNGSLEKGFTYESEIKPNSEKTLGDVNKAQWELELGKDTFESNTNLTMKVAGNDEIETLSSTDFKLLSAPITLNIANETNVRLDAPGYITVKLNQDYTDNYENLFFGYYVNDTWEYFVPDLIDMDKGLVSFTVYHFSGYGFGELSDDEQIKVFAQKIANDEWLRQNESSDLLAATKNQYNTLFENMGVTDTTLRNQFTSDMVSFLEEGLLDTNGVSPIGSLAQMANAASQGDAGKQAFIEKYIEFTGKALMATLERSPEAFGNLFSSSLTLSKIALALQNGEDTEALKGVGDLLKIAVPQTQLVETTLLFVSEKAKQAIDYWTQEELEKAYQAYAGNGSGKYGFTDSRDFDLIFTTLGGGQRMTELNIIAKWCKDRGIDEDSLGQAARDAIVNDAYTALKANFELRKVKEPEIEALKLNEESFIQALKNEGLMDPTQYKSFFKIDGIYNPTQRLKHLYQLKALVLNMIDDDIAQTITNEQLAIIIRQWVTFNEMNDRKAFYDYLKESKYLSDPKANANFAWVLIDTVTYDGKVQIDATNANGVYSASGSASPGSYSYTWSYLGDTDTYYDPDVIHGEGASVQATISSPPTIIQGGELVTLTINIAVAQDNLSYYTTSGTASADIDQFDVAPGFSTNAYEDFVNKDGKSSFDVNTYKTIQLYTNGDSVTATMPNGLNEGDKLAIRTEFFSSAIMGTNYIYQWKALE